MHCGVRGGGLAVLEREGRGRGGAAFAVFCGGLRSVLQKSEEVVFRVKIEQQRQLQHPGCAFSKRAANRSVLSFSLDTKKKTNNGKKKLS